MSLAPGTRLGPYEMLAPIGAGGMGEVYRARDTRLDRTVAIKILPEQLSGKPQLRERFEREARAVSSLNHPHICTLHDLGREGDLHYAVMEYLEGETLAHRLRKGPLPSEQVLEYAIQIADALVTAHRHGVIHRDVKPGNIMLTKKGAKLLDFGLAKMQGSGAAANRNSSPTKTEPLTGEGTILGTVQYMAPEQLEGKEADARSDLFALGAVIFEMATGKKAFEGTSQASLISAIMTSEPLPISVVQTMSPPALDHVVRTCLAKDPEMRWSTAHDVLTELEWIVAAGSPVGIPKPVVAHWKRRVLLLSVLLAGVSIGLLVGSFVLFRYRPPEVRPIRYSVSAPEKVTFDDDNPAVISPDGSRLAFVGVTEDGQRQLWLRPLDSLAAQPLAGTEGAGSPFWSPDSQNLAFYGNHKLKRVSINGGLPQIICNASSEGGGSWAVGPDGGPGTIVFGQEGPLFRVSAAGGEPVQITVLDSSRQEISHLWPEFLPDGRHFLFSGISYRIENSAVFIGDAQAKPELTKVRRLMSGDIAVRYSPPGYLLFVREHNLVAQPFDARRMELAAEPFVVAHPAAVVGTRHAGDFSVSATGVLAWRNELPKWSSLQLAWFSRGGKQIPGLDLRGQYVEPALSPDGKNIAVSAPNPAQPEMSWNVWIVDQGRNAPSRLTFGETFQEYAVWSPDGRRIVFGLGRPPSHGWGLFSKDLNGGGDEESLLKTPVESLPTDWSPDGRFILYYTYNEYESYESAEVWLLPAFGDRKPIPLLQTHFNELEGAFSPDGRWIAYSSDESGRSEVYVQRFTEDPPALIGSKRQVSTNGGEWPRWRRDGKELFFWSPNGRLMAAPVTIVSNFDARVPVALFEGHHAFPQYNVSPDGQRFLYSRQLEESHAPVNIYLNWLAGTNK